MFARFIVLAVLIAATTPSFAAAAPAEKPVAGKVVHFPQGTWSALPQVGPDDKVRQCVLVAARQRIGKDGPRIRCTVAVHSHFLCCFPSCRNSPYVTINSRNSRLAVCCLLGNRRNC